ncbi:hypothetical protein B0T10DRAFT_587231 [Thelonectria olida]|uniref:O-methyltransferase n=1 Tax=Thelonectria olida TaxID=1576542 RepID=A0A9P8WEQ2_9HYPO|nr:hypothetical protein B0T10DRAFT_587231 [Thelonectria olida]
MADTYQKIAAIAAEISREANIFASLPKGIEDSGGQLTDEQRAQLNDEEAEAGGWRLAGGIHSRIVSLVEELGRELKSPHHFLYELIASNWEKGALYTLLEHNVLELLPERGTVSLAELAEKTSIPPEKLLPILRLTACNDFIQEPVKEGFQHGAVSKSLVRDPDMKAFIGFQLFETRVASAHLADSLKKPNPTWTGQSAFRHAWGQSMYDWHKSHPENGARFKRAMKHVEECLHSLRITPRAVKANFGMSALDPKHSMALAWLRNNTKKNPDVKRRVVEVARFPSGNENDPRLAKLYPNVSFRDYIFPGKVEDFDPPTDGTIYNLHSALWNYSDEEVVSIMRVLANILEKQPTGVVLVNDLMSPAPGTASVDNDIIYRRRDVTVMTMHNAKMRTFKEWQTLFYKANPDLKLRNSISYGSHGCRVMWVIKLGDANTESFGDEPSFD